VQKPPEARRYGSPEADSDLRDVIDAWPALPGAIRAGILALVRTSLSH
jgi:hypothetical protein